MKDLEGEVLLERSSSPSNSLTARTFNAKRDGGDFTIGVPN